MICSDAGETPHSNQSLRTTLTIHKPKENTVVTDTILQTPVEARIAQATESLKKLEAEHIQLPARQSAAAAEVERLNHAITAAERSGSDAEALKALRSLRHEQQQLIEDLGRALPLIDRELEIARADLRAAMNARHASRYNQLTEKQRALTEVVLEAIETIVKTIQVKEGLARKQDDIQTGDVGCPYHNQTPEGMRLAYLYAITERLKIANANLSPLTLRGIDWTNKRMTDQGDLLPIE